MKTEFCLHSPSSEQIPFFYSLRAGAISSSIKGISLKKKKSSLLPALIFSPWHYTVTGNDVQERALAHGAHG